MLRRATTQVGLSDLGSAIQLADIPDDVRRIRATIVPCGGRPMDIWYSPVRRVDYGAHGLLYGFPPALDRYDLDGAARVGAALMSADFTDWANGRGTVSFNASPAPEFYARVTLTDAGAQRLAEVGAIQLPNTTERVGTAMGYVSCSYNDAVALIEMRGNKAYMRLDSAKYPEFWAGVDLRM